MSKHDIKTLEAEVQELRERVEKLEALLASAKGTSPSEEKKAALRAPAGEVSPDIILAISAAVAAFLGKRASIRQIRLSGETPWAMQGRATVQASHGAEYVRGRR